MDQTTPRSPLRQMTMKPNYMVIGAAKCATTTICSLLGRHPDVFMVACKEPQFFNRDDIFARGFDWYESLYAEAGCKTMRGEGSNASTMKELYPHALPRIAAYAPDLKLIYAVRDPFERIESYWVEKRSHGTNAVHFNFNKAVRVNRDWLVDSSNYLAQIDAYRRVYGDERIHVVFYEDFKADPQAVMRGCFEFLGVDPGFAAQLDSGHLNRSEGKRIPGAFLSRMQALPGYRKFARRVPRPFRMRVARRYFFRGVTSRPHWQPDTREWVADLLRDDLRSFLVRYGKPADFWSL